MGDVSVPKGATTKVGRVEGDLRVGHGARIEREGEGIEVTGRVICEGEAEFQGNLTCSEFSARGIWGFVSKIRIHGDLKAAADLKVENGQLTVDGSLDAKVVSVDKALWIGGDARADDFDVGGVLEVMGTISGKKVDVGGSFKVGGAAEVEEVDVGGRVDIAGVIKSMSLDVGGLARVGGGEVTKDVDVGGKFESTKLLRFSKIDVGGLATLNEGGTGGDVDVGGLLRVSGSLTLEKDLDIGGKAYIGAELSLDSLEVGGSMEANQIIAQKDIEVGGDLKTVKGAKADKVELGHNSRTSGPIVAREVSIGHGGRVEDVFADTLEMEHGSRARNLYFRQGTLESGVYVEGEVQYTGSIEASSDVRFAIPPSKVTELPKQPL